MKSVFEEASSIVKAIEKGWKKAGEPKKFSITIYEMPEKNFLGFTKKMAKVGIFFEDKVSSEPSRQYSKDRQRRPYRSTRPPQGRSSSQASSRQQQSRNRQDQPHIQAKKPEDSGSQAKNIGSQGRNSLPSQPHQKKDQSE